MPILQTEYGYVYKKNKKRTNMPMGIKLFFVFVLCVGVIVACMYIFSITNLTTIFGLNKYKIFDEVNYYAVVVASGDSYFDVSGVDTEIKQQGGSGYVFKIDKKFYVVANVYGSEQDAQKVCDNLSGDFDANVLTIKFSKLVLTADYTSQQINELKNSLQMVNLCYQKLYEVCISLDKGEILSAEAKQKLQVFKESCQYQKEKLSNVFADNCDNIVTNVKIFNSEVISSLNAVILSDNLSVDLKYTIASLINSFLTLENSITK